MTNPASVNASAGLRCVVCGRDNRPGLLICDSCGSRLLAPGERAKLPDGTQTTLLLERLACPRCRHENPPAAPRCTRCGQRLSPRLTSAALTSSASRAVSSERTEPVAVPPPPPEAPAGENELFLPGMWLQLKMSEAGAPLILRPKAEMVIGRSDPTSSVGPDIDLTAYAAYRLGVSRKHAALRLDGEVLDIRDLGSSNGSFVNGVRLAAYQPRRLRSGDEVSLGDLHLRVHFVRGGTRDHNDSLHR